MQYRFFYHKNDPTYNIQGDFMQMYILHFRNNGVGSMELENAFCCPIGDMYNHDNDVVRVFRLITLVGKFNVMYLYINIASLHGADACCIDHCWIFSWIIKTINAFCGTLIGRHDLIRTRFVVLPSHWCRVIDTLPYRLCHNLYPRLFTFLKDTISITLL